MNDSQIVKLIQNLISTTVEKIIDKKLRGKYLICRKAVIVKNYDRNTNRATVFIPTDPNVESNYAYYNKTGRDLTTGQKVYLTYQLNSISQGWLENIYPSTLDDLHLDKSKLIIGGYNLNTSQSQTMDDMVSNFGFQYGAKTDAPTTGVFISASGLNDNYVFQITCDYQAGKGIFFRVKNGDNQTWQPWYRLPIITDSDAYCEMSGKGGFLGIDGCTGNYLRTPPNGLLPNVPGGSGNVGTDDWRFYGGYFEHMNISNHLTVGGYNNGSYNISTNSIITDNWFRSSGVSGWYNETYGGGIYMYDSKVTVSHSKGLRVNNIVQADGYYITNPSGGDVGYAVSGGLRGYTQAITSMLVIDGQPLPHVRIITPWNTRSTSWGVDINFSDKRLKDNIQEIPLSRPKTRNSISNYIDALGIVKQINHYSYDVINMEENADCHVNLGYVADELELIYPDGVYEVGDSKIKHISNARMFPLLSLAIKQQNVIVEEQKTKIEDLEKRIKDLEILIGKKTEEGEI